MPRHYILTPIGSAGDVHPFVGIGARLRERGHTVTVITADVFRDLCERAKLRFVSAASAEDFQRTIQHPHLWHPRRGIRHLLRTMSEHLEVLYGTIESVWSASNPRDTVLIGHTLSFAARVFEESHNVPAVTVQLSPSVFRSNMGQPTIAPGLNLSHAPRWCKQLLWWLIDRHYIDPYVVPALNKCRATHGLAPIVRPFKGWMHSPQGVIGLFPDWFGPPESDWPAPLHLTGFPLFDESDTHAPNEALETFLAAGDAPFVFTPGSANMQAPMFFRTAIEASLLLKRRALLLTRFRDQLPASLPANVMHVSYVPFSHVLPRCAALVHHGGIGTCAQGLAAGVPQLVMPMGFDQPDNAARLKRLGVGASLVPRKFNARRVAAALQRLVASPTTAHATQQCAKQLQGVNAINKACDAIEALHPLQARGLHESHSPVPLQHVG